VLGHEVAALETELQSYELPVSDRSAEAPPAMPDSFDLVQCLLCLQRAPELRGLGVAVLAALLRDHEPSRLEAGAELFAAGTEAERFFVLVHGEVDCTPAAAAGRFLARVGDVLGRDAALASLPYQYTAVAKTPAAAIGIDAQVFWDVAEDHFHVARAALSMCARRLLWLQNQRAERGMPATRPAFTTPILMGEQE
jgi:CRP-like cAMP-binding protein